MLFGGHTGVGARRVDERDDREAEPLGDLEDSDRLQVALRIGHAELALEALLDVAALLVTDQCDRSAVERAETRDQGSVVRPAAVAVQLDPIGQDPRDVVERVRTVGVPRQLDRAPDRLVARIQREPLQLALQPRRLARDPHSAQERQA